MYNICLDRLTYFFKDFNNHPSDDTWLQKCCNVSQLTYKGYHAINLFFKIIN